MISRSASRPKKYSAWASVNGISPVYGHSDTGSRLGLRQETQPAAKNGDVAIEIEIENLDVAPAPRAPIEIRRAELNRPGLIVHVLLVGDAMEDNAQIPVAQSVAQKQEVAATQLRQERHRHQIREIGPSEIVD